MTPACDRCGGRLFLESDHLGQFFGCLQCGNTIELDRRGRVAATLGYARAGAPSTPDRGLRAPSRKGGRL